MSASLGVSVQHLVLNSDCFASVIEPPKGCERAGLVEPTTRVGTWLSEGDMVGPGPLQEIA